MHFFGHRDTPESIRPLLAARVENLILDKQVDTFFVGNHGGFDRMVKETLLQLQKKYPHITCLVVLAYLPGPKKEEPDFPEPKEEDLPTIYPGLERVPQRFAITYRNRWMVEQADYVIEYIWYSWGGAWQFFQMAQCQKKQPSISMKNHQPTRPTP